MHLKVSAYTYSKRPENFPGNKIGDVEYCDPECTDKHQNLLMVLV